MRLKKLSDKMGFRIRRIPPSALEIQRRLFEGRNVGTVFDVGASIGDVSAAYRKLFPSAAIHAFEPDPASFDRLQKVMTGDRNFTANAVAVSDRPGTATLQINASSGTNSLLPKSTVSDQWVSAALTTPVKTITVPTVTVDGYCAEKGIDHIDILKLDIQGLELPVLKGAEALLKAGAVDLIYSEVEFLPLYENQGLFVDICNYLQPFGYTFHGLYNLNVKKPLHRLLWADAIFLSPKAAWPGGC